MSVEEQCQWIRESLTSFPQFPNRTNHDAIYGPIPDLFVSATQGKTLVFEERDSDCVDSETGNPKWKLVEEMDRLSGSDAYKSIQASLLLRKLRWSTLGLQFDWSKVKLKVFLIFLFILFINFVLVSIFLSIIHLFNLNGYLVVQRSVMISHEFSDIIFI